MDDHRIPAGSPPHAANSAAPVIDAHVHALREAGPGDAVTASVLGGNAARLFAGALRSADA
jgi:hypothetical protein